MDNAPETLIENEEKMPKNGLIETILMIINKILDYTSTLEQKMPSIFDENKEIQNECESDKLNTSSSSNDENVTFNDKNYTLHDYFYYWVEKLDFNENLLILTMMNIDKFLSKNFILTPNNVKNILFSCMVLTQKSNEDETIYDKDYAKIFKIKTDELINMELEFLKIIDYRLFVSGEEFDNYKSRMVKIWKQNFSYFTFG
jgi:hypothetical protein